MAAALSDADRQQQQQHRQECDRLAELLHREPALRRWTTARSRARILNAFRALDPARLDRPDAVPPSTRWAVKAALELLGGAEAGGRAAAARRWPAFWTGGRHGRALQTAGGGEADLARVLPRAVFDAGPQSEMWRLFARLHERLRLCLGRRCPSSMRKALSFLHGFLQRGVLAGGEAGAGAGGIAEAVAAQDRASLIAAYERYHRGRPPVALHTLCTHLALVSRLFGDVLHLLRAPLTPADFGVAGGGGVGGQPPFRRRRNEGGTGRHGPVSATPGSSSVVCSVERVRALLVGGGEATTTTTAKAGVVVAAKKACSRAGDEEEERVHTFTAAEVRALYLACETVFERCLLTALCTTAMRIGGFSRLERRPAVTASLGGGNNALSVGPEALSTEKGNRRTVYALSPVLRTLLAQWCSGQPDGRWMFPSRDHPDLPISVGACARTFHRVARRAGLRGRHVRPGWLPLSASPLCLLPARVGSIPVPTPTRRGTPSPGRCGAWATARKAFYVNIPTNDHPFLRRAN